MLIPCSISGTWKTVPRFHFQLAVKKILKLGQDFTIIEKRYRKKILSVEMLSSVKKLSPLLSKNIMCKYSFDYSIEGVWVLKNYELLCFKFLEIFTINPTNTL